MMVATLLAGLSFFGVAGQQFGDLQGDGAGARQPREHVTYAAEPALIPAGKRAVLEVRLVVGNGYHVNSHTPKSDLLIATAATLKPGDAGIRMEPVEYPRGASYSFPADPGEVLDVYTGAVVLRVPVVAAAGEHVLQGTLRYQACDQKSCFPPRTLALVVPFTAK